MVHLFIDPQVVTEQNLPSSAFTLLVAEQLYRSCWRQSWKKPFIMFLLIKSGPHRHSADNKAHWSSSNCFPSQWMGDSLWRKEQRWWWDDDKPSGLVWESFSHQSQAGLSIYGVAHFRPGGPCCPGFSSCENASDTAWGKDKTTTTTSPWASEAFSVAQNRLKNACHRRRRSRISLSACLCICSAVTNVGNGSNKLWIQRWEWCIEIMDSAVSFPVRDELHPVTWTL